MDSNGKPLIEGAKYSLFMVDPQSVSNKKRSFIKVYNGPKYADGITFFVFDGEGYRQGEIIRGNVKVTYNSPGSTNGSGSKGGRHTNRNKSARRKTKTRRHQKGGSDCSGNYYDENENAMTPSKKAKVSGWSVKNTYCTTLYDSNGKSYPRVLINTYRNPRNGNEIGVFQCNSNGAPTDSGDACAWAMEGEF